ncbi:EF-hand domain-containing protein [Insolitispirillum peregrinum]|uniref:EF-hand domain-containing protein n=1 Tax=Insolitispirillum peregrinum TaxID=80876 RepID=UPI0036091C2E
MVSSLTSSTSTYEYSSLFSSSTNKDSKTATSQDALLQALNNVQANAAANESAAASQFTALDTDGDGTLSQEEFSSFGSMMSPMTGSALLSAQESATSSSESDTESDSESDLISSMDTDGDGVVSESEFSTAVSSADSEGTLSDSDIAAMFDALDSDGDGSISSDESDAATSSMAGDMPPPPPPAEEATTSEDSSSTSTDSTSSSSSSGSSSSGSGSSESHDPLDTNEDGVVSAEERAAAQNSGMGRLSSGMLGALLQFNEVSGTSQQAAAA